MKQRDSLIQDLDGADLFLRNRANSLPTPLNEYDIEEMLDIAKICGETARTLEKAIVPPCNVGDFVYVIYAREIQPTKVFSMKIESEDDHYIFYFKCMVYQGGNRFEKFVYGKTVFLTREEAEAELERRMK